MWNSFSTDALVGLAAEVITFPGGYDDEIHAWVARPTGEGAEGTLPGVVAVHHMPGWDEFYREFSERLARQPVSSGKVGIIGTCSGGRHALLVASRVAGFDAVADLWGGGVIMAKEDLSEARPVAPIDYTAGLSAPLLGVFGKDDRHPTPEQVNRHEEELKRHGKEYEFHRYDGAGHGFFYYHTPMYRPEQAMDGWAKVFGFFGRHLNG